jgi:hypothetical protein
MTQSPGAMHSRLVLAPLIAAALSCGESASAQAAAPKQVLAEVSADLNGDGVADRAVLLHDPDGDDVDLAIYLSADGKTPSQPSLYKTAFGWTGAMAGTEPEISVNKAGSLLVVFQNDAIGRDRWRQQFTIAFRGGALVVAGYDYQARDTLRPGGGGNCDLNFLAGRGTRNGKPIKVTGAPTRLGDWTDKSAPAACSFE